MDNDDVRSLIIDLRGGIPNNCDFCGKGVNSNELHPEEAGEWICNDCIKAIISKTGHYP